MPPERIVVIGLHGDDDSHLPKRARLAIEQAQLVVGGRRHLAAFAAGAPNTAVIAADVGGVLDQIDAVDGAVAVLASGDPGFFGIVRPLAERFGPHRLDVHPAASSVALAFARLGLSWDDALVVSAHGRRLDEAVTAAFRHPKVAVLISPDNSASLLGQALLAAGSPPRAVAVCSRLGLDAEQVVQTDLGGLAEGTWDPLSVVVLMAEGPPVPDRKTLAWGLPEALFTHRAGMVTKAEVRAVALGKLDLPPDGVLWDVGAGSGSVAIECARLAPGLDVHAVEREPEDVDRIATNAREFGVRIRIHAAEAPAALGDLPDPDRVFVGGGGLTVLEACLGRLRAGGQIVAMFAAMDRAIVAAERLGSLTQVSVARSRPLPGGGLRLAAENPVFVVWGPQP